jgi:hypothetical protein
MLVRHGIDDSPIPGVASGASGAEELLAEGANQVLPDLCDTSAVVEAVLAVRRERRLAS